MLLLKRNSKFLFRTLLHGTQKLLLEYQNRWKTLWFILRQFMGFYLYFDLDSWWTDTSEVVFQMSVHETQLQKMSGCAESTKFLCHHHEFGAEMFQETGERFSYNNDVLLNWVSGPNRWFHELLISNLLLTLFRHMPNLAYRNGPFSELSIFKDKLEEM